MAMIVKVDGTNEQVEPENGTDFSLEELRKYIGGGYVERIPLEKGLQMWMDEDGKRKRPFNPAASVIYAFHKLPDYAPDYIHGDVLICRMEEVL